MNIKNNIVYADSSGGVKSVSESLFFSFSEHSIKSSLINLNDFDHGFFKKIYKILQCLLQLKKDDVLILQHFYPIFIGLLLRFFGYSKLINVVHTDLVEYYASIGLLKKAIISFVFFFLKNDVIVFVSKESEIKAVEKFKLKNTRTIYNVCCFSNNDRFKNRFNKKIKLGSISRLNKTKNIDLLIRVFKKVKCTIPNAELLIYGSGDEQAKLEQYIKQQGCADFVKLLGPSNDKDAMYTSIDAMVSFSSIEGFGMTILESIGYGIPVFYTDCSSGPRELMSPTTDPLAKTASYEKTNIGYLVKPTQNTATYSQELDDYETEYVDIMLAFIDDLKNTRFSMEYDPDRFSEKTIVKQWQELIVMSN